MKIIDLLNKIANGEEVLANIKYDGIDYYWCNSCKIYERIEDGRNDLYNDIDNLNDEVEILEEEKKIPEKLNWKSKESMAGQLTQKEQIEVIARRTEKLKKEFNSLLDYLKSKGE